MLLTQRNIRARAACAVAALAVTGCGAGGGSPGPTAHASSASSRAPSCLPSTLDHSAALAGTSVDVTPAPGTDTADPRTQISFLGASGAQIQSVSVVGSRSGAHAGSLDPYSQGDGASFVPSTPFDAGEQVSVHATVAGKPVAFGFGVDSPYSTASVGGFANPTAPAGDYQSFLTLPGVQAPVMTVTAPDRDPAAGDLFLTNGPGAGRYGPMIYTPQGRLVWFHQLTGGTTAENLNVQTYEGERDLTFWQGRVLALGFGQGDDYVLDSNYRIVATVRAGNGLAADLHEFQIAPNGVAYLTAFNPIRCDLSVARGPRDGAILDATIEEVDIKSGLVRWEWHSLDHVATSESEAPPPSASAWDWIHLNSIDPEPNGDLLISARNTSAEYQLQGGSGVILWRLGGRRSSFRMGAGTRTAWQHDARMLADGDVTLFDDGSDPPVERQSRAVTIALDMQRHQARLVSAYTHSPPVLAASQGNMQTLADGNTLVGFGAVPEITEYGRRGATLFDAHLPLDQVFYRAYRFPWSGRPLTPPAVFAGLNNTALETIVHMSWNGATGVAAWRVLAGNSPRSLAAQPTIATTGFESSTILLEAYRYVAVQALDGSGHVLGTSRTVRVVSFAASFPSGGRQP